MGPAGLPYLGGMSGIANACLSCLSTVDRWCHITACLGPIGGRPRDIYEATLADNEREAVSDLLGYLENVCCHLSPPLLFVTSAPCSYGAGEGVYRHQLLTSFIFWFNSEAKPISFLANPFDRLVL